MFDPADLSEKSIEDRVNEGVENASIAASQIPAGEPGDCDFCGEWSGRLVGGACAPCREKRRLP